MSLKYREDDGLAVLALADEADIGRLADLLTHDETDGNLRVAQELLDEPGFVQARAEGRVAAAWQLVAAELQAFGGDGVANRIRSLKGDHTGVPYQEVLADIARYVGADLKGCDGVVATELLLVQRLLIARYFPKTGHDIGPHARSAAREFGQARLIDGSLGAEALPELLRDDDAFFLDAIAVLRRLPLFSISAPGLAVASIKTWALPGAAVSGVTGPALRITVPAMLEVARIRRKVLRNPMKLSEV